MTNYFFSAETTELQQNKLCCASGSYSSSQDLFSHNDRRTICLTYKSVYMMLSTNNNTLPTVRYSIT